MDRNVTEEEEIFWEPVLRDLVLVVQFMSTIALVTTFNLILHILLIQVREAFKKK